MNQLVLYKKLNYIQDSLACSILDYLLAQLPDDGTIMFIGGEGLYESYCKDVSPDIKLDYYKFISHAMYVCPAYKNCCKSNSIFKISFNIIIKQLLKTRLRFRPLYDIKNKKVFDYFNLQTKKVDDVFF